MSSLEFDQWNDAGGNPVMRINAGELQVWNGSAWQAAGVAPLSSSNVTGTTGSPTITTDGAASIYSFTGSGSITLDQGGTCDILLVAGGGAGGFGAGGGGGGGGVLYLQSAYLPEGTHTVTVGVGGPAILSPTDAPMPGQNGQASAIGSLYYAVGGAGGASRIHRYSSTFEGTYRGFIGGSGSGAAGGTSYYAAHGNTGGAGISGQGNAGGDSSTTTFSGGGGGGAGAVGGNAGSNVGGNGGNGTSISITGSAVTYAGGGGGAATTPGSGGSGGGGAGSYTTNATDGTDGLGGGGGGKRDGATSTKAGDGGTGIVIVRFAS